MKIHSFNTGSIPILGSGLLYTDVTNAFVISPQNHYIESSNKTISRYNCRSLKISFYRGSVSLVI